MLNPAHILEIALLLLVAFLLGAVVGSLARLVAARLLPAKAPAISSVAATTAVAEPPKPEEVPALVAAPAIGEVVKTPTPTAPADVPAPDFTEVLLALAGDKPGSPASRIRMPSIAPLPVVAVTKPAAEMGPARAAGETTSGRGVAHPRSAAEPARAISMAGAGAEVIPFPLDKLAVESSEPSVVAVPVPAVEPATPIVAAPEQSEPEPQVVSEPAAELDIAPSPLEAAVQPAAAVIEAEATAVVEVPSPETDAVTDVAAVAAPVEEPPAARVDVTRVDAPLPPEPVAAAASEPLTTTDRDADDEAAAMRAIEGNWSPRRAAASRPRKVDLPELSAEAAVMASAAVASATEAASLVAAPEPEAPGRPTGIPAPRLGVKDDLTHVIGILPIIETALNNLGLYHFDQVAELTDENAGWIENHLGIAGRIGREHWREQSRELALALAGTKKAAGQQ